ncbi:hypothetical protein GQR58_030196 [Nymphon striatum]|nr:hypothetical protein GQR58_030196 [Nymphon striatum]
MRAKTNRRNRIQSARFPCCWTVPRFRSCRPFALPVRRQNHRSTGVIERYGHDACTGYRKVISAQKSMYPLNITGTTRKDRAGRCGYLGCQHTGTQTTCAVQNATVKDQCNTVIAKPAFDSATRGFPQEPAAQANLGNLYVQCRATFCRKQGGKTRGLSRGRRYIGFIQKDANSTVLKTLIAAGRKGECSARQYA